MATKQFLMLDKISMEYHAFRKDQVLTHTQLNELIDFFEDQDRLTRTCLVGVGLVCGLSVSFDAGKPSISVGKGCGVTTDGDLLMFDTTTFNDFKVYDNRKKGTSDSIYDPFWPLPGGDKQIDLWELVIPDTDGNLPLDSGSLSTFDATTGKQLADMTALLYLEYYLQDPDKCTAIDCDNQGPRQVAQVKVLLLTKIDMEKVINRDPNSEVIADSIYKKYYDSGAQYFNLPMLKPKRVLLNSANTASIAMLAKSYTGIVQAGGIKLISAIGDLYNNFKFMIDPLSKTDIVASKQALQQALNTHPKIYHAQYLYDYYKDVITAYNELRDWLFRCMYECCPDKYAFPKHIMLGELKPFGTEPARYRHEFYPSPAVADCKEKVLQSRTMWLRLLGLMQQFNLPDQPSAVKITPSTDYDRCLEKRAIPFYYKDVKLLVASWNYSGSKRGTQNNLLSYHAGQYAGGLDSTLNPLDYSVDENNFYRVEGHLGKQLSAAMQQIDTIRKNKSVPFDLVAVRINKLTSLKDIDPNDFECQFEDLNAILKAWLIEQNCLYANISRFFSGFTTNKESGFHVRLDQYSATGTPVYAAGIKEFGSVPVSGIRFTGEQPVYTAVGVFPQPVSEQPLCKTTYTIDKTIYGNLELDREALGSVFYETLKNPAYSADDVIADIKRRTASDANLSTLSAEEMETVYEVPITLVAHANEISQTKPFAVNEISMDLLETYMQRMERLCMYVKLLRSRMETIFNSQSYTTRGFESYYLFLIQQLVANCCAAEKLESLMNEINRRKMKILDSLLFANYATQHPGLEHKAGVHRGGTLVLLYANEVRTASQVAGALIREFEAKEASEERIFLSYDTLSKADFSAGWSVYGDIDSFAYYLVTHQGQVDFDEQVTIYMKLHGIRDGSLEEQIFNNELKTKIKEICAKLTQDEEATIAANVVVADFTLPYLCCSDCPPMAFIMPKTDYNLSLPKASACNDEAILLFHKEPADGVVKAAAGFEATIVDNEGNTFFDPSKVPEASFGTEISFTIDDQVTDCRISVFKHPVAEAKFNLEKESTDQVMGVLQNLSDDATGSAYLYDWDLGDGRVHIKTDKKDPLPISWNKFTLDKLNLNGIIPVKLTATNGPCADVFPLNIPYQKEVPVSLSLPKQVVCNDAAQLQFTLQPPDGVVASADEPASVVKLNDNWFFDPTKATAFNKVITFTVNGKATNCQITVLQHPQPKFEARAALVSGVSGMMAVTFQNLTDPANNQGLNYHWEFSDKTSKDTSSTAEFTQQFNFNILKSQGQTALTVLLTASNAACDGKSQPQSVPFPQETSISQTCQDAVKIDVAGDLENVQSPQIKSYLAGIQTNPQFTAIRSQWESTVKVLNDANAQVANFSQPAVQQTLLSAVATQLQNIYACKFDKKTNDVVVTPEVQALMKLTLNIVKCETTLTGTVMELLQRIIKDFIERISSLKTMIPFFNKDSVMNKFIENYLPGTKLKDAQLITLIKELNDKIKSTFAP